MLKINSLRNFLGLKVWTICGKARARFALPVFFGAFSLTMLACGGESRNEGESGPGRPVSQVEDSRTEFCRNLWLGTRFGESVAEIRTFVGRDTVVQSFVMRRGDGERSKPLPPELSGATVLRVPLQKVVALSSAQIGYLLRLGLEDRIVGVGEGRYIADSAFYVRVAAGEVAEVGNGPTLSLEKLVALAPDLVMNFATGGGHDDYERILSLGVPLMLASEWQEESPLAKAEWIKLYGLLFGVETLADSIFEQSKNNYLKFASRNSDDGLLRRSASRNDVQGYTAQELAHVLDSRISHGSQSNDVSGDSTPNSEFRTPNSPDTLSSEDTLSSLVSRLSSEDTLSSLVSRLSSNNCPRVLAGMSYGGVWYAPGGNSYTARLIKDAGGCYLWAADTNRELKFTLEEIMLVADSADVWVNPGMFSTPEELLAAEPRVKFIRSFREKRVCQNDGRKGPGGGNDFFESAVLYPAELLLNLRKCLRNHENRGDSALSGFDWYHNIF